MYSGDSTDSCHHQWTEEILALLEACLGKNFATKGDHGNGIGGLTLTVPVLSPAALRRLKSSTCTAELWAELTQQSINHCKQLQKAIESVQNTCSVGPIGMGMELTTEFLTSFNATEV